LTALRARPPTRGNCTWRLTCPAGNKTQHSPSGRAPSRPVQNPRRKFISRGGAIMFIVAPVIITITQARAPSTRQDYALKWSLFVDWCSSHREVTESCLEFGPADSHIILRGQPGYVPKIPTNPFWNQVVNLQVLPLEEAHPVLELLCPVCSLRIYV
ncbi:hypothetical protein M9458_037264, partial [Cirrhinus mrigala]